MADDESKLLRAAGAAVGRQIQARIAANRTATRYRRTRGQWRKSVEWRPTDPYEFIVGGMLKIECLAGQRARDEAIRSERELWLPRLVHWREAHGDDPGVRAVLDGEIKRLRRTLGIRIQRTPDELREHTRRRVQAYRKRQRAARV
jgi:hypothetical protein